MKKAISILMLIAAIMVGTATAEAKTTKKKSKGKTSASTKITSPEGKIYSCKKNGIKYMLVFAYDQPLGMFYIIENGNQQSKVNFTYSQSGNEIYVYDCPEFKYGLKMGSGGRTLIDIGQPNFVFKLEK